MDIRSLGQTVKYTTEALGKARSYNSLLKSLAPDSSTAKVLSKNPVSNCAAGEFGSIIYDMCSGKKTPEGRRLVGQNSAKMLLLEVIVDDIIDKRRTPLEEKERILRNVGSTILGGKAYAGKDSQENASYALAKSLNCFVRQYDSSELEKIVNEISDQTIEQFRASDSSILDVTMKLGACSADSSAVLSQMVLGKPQQARHSARKIGEYAQLLDDLYDLDVDIKEGTNTYPVSVLRARGDTPAVRKDIKKEIMSLANEAITEGMDGLDENNKRICKSLKNLVDAKYVLKGLKR